MIKINLVKSKVGEGGAAEVNISYDSGAASKAEGLLKLFLMGAFVIAAIFYRNNQIERLMAEANAIAKQVTVAQQELEQKKKEAGARTELEEEARELKNKLNILRNLSRIRLTEVKSLDFIQSIVPERVWLRSIKYQNSEFSINGFSVSDEDMTEFLKGLEASPYFADVILLQSREEKGRSGTVKTFEIGFKVKERT